MEILTTLFWIISCENLICPILSFRSVPDQKAKQIKHANKKKQNPLPLARYHLHPILKWGRICEGLTKVPMHMKSRAFYLACKPLDQMGIMKNQTYQLFGNLVGHGLGCSYKWRQWYKSPGLVQLSLNVRFLSSPFSPSVSTGQIWNIKSCFGVNKSQSILVMRQELWCSGVFRAPFLLNVENTS